MIELSFAKLFLVALVALIVLGPDKLPGAARTAGVLVRRVRASWDNVRADVARELALDDVRHAAQEATGALTAAQQAFRDNVRRMHEPFIPAANDLPDVAASPAPPAPTLPVTECPHDDHA